MISKQHNDGGCFKLTIETTDYEEGSFEKYIRYCEDFNELLEHGREALSDMENHSHYLLDFRIQDDSK